MNYLYVLLLLLLTYQPSYTMNNTDADALPLPLESKRNWRSITRAIEAKEARELPFQLGEDTVNQQIVSKGRSCSVLYLLVKYALNTDTPERVKYYTHLINHALVNEADVNQFNGNETALMYLARFASRQHPDSKHYKADQRVIQVLNFLLRHKPNLNLRHQLHGGTALRMAIGTGYNKAAQQVIGALVSAHADCNKPDLDGVTPIMQAARIGSFDFIQQLISGNATITQEQLDAMPDLSEELKLQLQKDVQITQEITNINAALNAIELKKTKERMEQLAAKIQAVEKMSSDLDKSIAANESTRRMQRQPSDD